ncbi:dipeptidyl peptidase 4-like isoform X1 [Montipora capricornis]|uniref:dipeptidyl peptidase 4-like isoform X1 n=2 Tax=Montipora capricornis TaxID=246305 RepID=UPI0035F15F85
MTTNFRKFGIPLIVVSLLTTVAIVVALLLSQKTEKQGDSNEQSKPPENVFGFDDIFNGKYSFSSYSVRWLSDHAYLRYSDGNLTVTNLSKNTTTLFAVTKVIMKKYNVSSYWISPDEKWVLMASNKKKLYRRSYFADYYVHHLENRSTFRIEPPIPNKQIQLALWGNKGTSIGLVQDNNIYWLDKVAGNLHTITNNGKENEVYNGVPDWVYEEDVTLSNSAMWFSPDGRYLIFVQSNDTLVKWFPYMWYGKNSAIYTTVKRIPYPKPGSMNPVVTIKLVDLENIPLNLTETPNTTVLHPPTEFQAVEHYYTNVAWASNSSVMIWWLNRAQNKAIASMCNATTAICNENQHLNAKNGWVNSKSYLPPSPLFARDGSYYLTLVPSAQGNHGDFIHLAKVMIPSSINKTVTFLTSGTWEVTRILAFNEKTETLYFQSSETSSRERHIYSVNVQTMKKACLSCDLPWAKNGDCKYFTASFSPRTSWYILNCYGPKVPRFTLHKSNDATWYKELQMNKALETKLAELSTPKRRNFLIPAGEYELPATEFLPPNFDENKKYAVQFQVYGGPGSQMVNELFSSALGWTAYLVSNFDVIVVTVDGRGTGYRGERFKQSVYKLLGEHEAQDVIIAGRFMQKKKYVDPERLSVWGWSFGGFLTTYVLSKNTRVFKCGIAVAPVTDWRYYDSAYTERYMDLPQRNPKGYKDTSLLSRAANFSNVDYLIIHGSGDDNVHYQNTAQMVKALTEAEIKFRVQYYTDKAHGITGKHTRRHLFRLMTNFLAGSLGLTHS